MFHCCIESLRKNVRNRWCSFRRQNDMQMLQNCFKIYAKSVPKWSGNFMSNKVGKMVDGQAGRDPPSPAGLKYRQHQKSIHPAIHVISSSPLIDFPRVALITRRGIQYVGSELATCESMVTKRCPSCDPEMPTSCRKG